MIPATAQTDTAPAALPVRTGRGRHQPARQIELVLPAILESAHVARGHTQAALNVWDLAHLTDTAVLITSELITNAIIASTAKAPPGKEGRPVILSIAARDGELLTRVWDPDPEMPAPDDPAPDDPYAEGGRGLLLVAELSRQSGWHPGNGGKYVWSSLPLQKPAALTAPAQAASSPPPHTDPPHTDTSPWACTGMTPRRRRAPSAARQADSQRTAGHPPATRSRPPAHHATGRYGSPRTRATAGNTPPHPAQRRQPPPPSAPRQTAPKQPSHPPNSFPHDRVRSNTRRAGKPGRRCRHLARRLQQPPDHGPPSTITPEGWIAAPDPLPLLRPATPRPSPAQQRPRPPPQPQKETNQLRIAHVPWPPKIRRTPERKQQMSIATETGITPDAHANPAPVTDGPLSALWAEITRKCQLSCVHCYAGSGPDGTHGTMTPQEWETALTQAAALGTRMVCFIGGEPTLHPDLPRLVRHTLSLGMTAEVFSNLVHVTPELWDLLTTPGVRLATSWYTSDRLEHQQITGRDTWRQTLASIEEAVRRDIPLRAGVIDGILPGQHTEEGKELLRACGVTDIGGDHLREFGRGTNPDPTQACGNCGHHRAAILPDGTVTPCPLTRWMNAGNITTTPLADIVGTVTQMAATIPAQRAICPPDGGLCEPDKQCPPDNLCNPTGRAAAQTGTAERGCAPDDC